MTWSPGSAAETRGREASRRPPLHESPPGETRPRASASRPVTIDLLRSLQDRVRSAAGPLAWNIDYTHGELNDWADALGIEDEDGETLQLFVDAVAKADEEAASDLATELLRGRHPDVLVLVHVLRTGPDAGATAIIRLARREIEHHRVEPDLAALAMIDALCSALISSAQARGPGTERLVG